MCHFRVINKKASSVGLLLTMLCQITFWVAFNCVTASLAEATPRSPTKIMLCGDLPKIELHKISNSKPLAGIQLVPYKNLPQVHADSHQLEHQQALLHQIESDIQRVPQLYYEARLEEAAQILAQHIDRHELLVINANRFDLFNKLHHWNGIILSKLKKSQEAQEQFIQALQIQDSSMDPLRFAPQVVAVFKHAKEQLQNRPRGLLTLTVPPDYHAKIYVNGKKQQQSTFELSYGIHWLTVKAFGYKPKTQRVSLASSHKEITIALDPASPSVILQQLKDLQQKGDLSLIHPQMAAAIARLEGIPEVIIIQRLNNRDNRAQVELERVRSQNGVTLAKIIKDVGDRSIVDVVSNTLPILVGSIDAAQQRRQGARIYHKWWFWTALGIAITAGAVGVITAATSTETTYSFRFVK